jgi:regulator of replication initiation timing
MTIIRTAMPVLRRRASDRQPNRELWLQELCNRLTEENLQLKAENTRLRTELNRYRNDAMTQPGELI